MTKFAAVVEDETVRAHRTKLSAWKEQLQADIDSARENLAPASADLASQQDRLAAAGHAYLSLNHLLGRTLQEGGALGTWVVRSLREEQAILSTVQGGAENARWRIESATEQLVDLELAMKQLCRAQEILDEDSGKALIVQARNYVYSMLEADLTPGTLDRVAEVWTSILEDPRVTPAQRADLKIGQSMIAEARLNIVRINAQRNLGTAGQRDRRRAVWRVLLDDPRLPEICKAEVQNECRHAG